MMLFFQRKQIDMHGKYAKYHHNSTTLSSLSPPPSNGLNFTLHLHFLYLLYFLTCLCRIPFLGSPTHIGFRLDKFSVFLNALFCSLYVRWKIKGFEIEIKIDISLAPILPELTCLCMLIILQIWRGWWLQWC